jgi:hypothetical protein
MTSRAENLDFDLLPERAREFFDLSESSRIALKRRYIQLINIYKPETQPLKFQAIRVAYELMGDWLDGGYDITASGGFSSSKHDDSKAADHETVAVWMRRYNIDEEDLEEAGSAFMRQMLDDSSESPDQTDQDWLIAQLAEHDPVPVQLELKQKQSKTVYQYYALAVLADVCGDDENSFIDWLLEGLKAYPDEPGLRGVVFAYAKSAVGAPAAETAHLLESLAHALSADLYFYTTEVLWHDYAEKVDEATFDELLDRCEAVIAEYEMGGKVAFYLGLVKRLWFTRDDAWLDRRVQYLDDFYDDVHYDIPHFMRSYKQLFAALTPYKATRDAFLGFSHPLRQQIDAMIHTYCEADLEDAARAVLETQHRLIKGGDELLTAFPLGDPTAVPALEVLRTIVNDHLHDDSDRVAIVFQHRTESFVRDSVKELGAAYDTSWRHAVGEFVRSTDISPEAVAERMRAMAAEDGFELAALAAMVEMDTATKFIHAATRFN